MKLKNITSILVDKKDGENVVQIVLNTDKPIYNKNQLRLLIKELQSVYKILQDKSKK